MLAFVKKHFFIFLFTGIGILIGLFTHLKSDSIKMYRIIYEYDPFLSESVPIQLLSDTLFYNDEFLIRNTNSSFADTLNSVKRSELKVYSERDLNLKEIEKIIIKISHSKAHYNSHRKSLDSRSIVSALSYIIFGLFIGSLIHLLKSRMLVP